MGIVDWMGSHTFVYDSSQTSTVATQSQFHLSQEIQFSMGRYSYEPPVEPLALLIHHQS